MFRVSLVCAALLGLFPQLDAATVTCPGAHQSFVANPSTYCEPLCEPYGSNYTCTELNISNPGCRCDFGYLRYRATYECVKFTKCWYLQFTSKINYILKKISGKS